MLAAILMLVRLGLRAALLRDQVPVPGAQTVPESAATPAAASPARAAAEQLQGERNTTDIVSRYEPGPGLVIPSRRWCSSVRWGGEQNVPALVVGPAPQDDLALVHAERLDALKPGQKALAVGAPFGLDCSVTEGIVSSIERQIPAARASPRRPSRPTRPPIPATPAARCSTRAGA